MWTVAQVCEEATDYLKLHFNWWPEHCAMQLEELELAKLVAKANLALRVCAFGWFWCLCQAGLLPFVFAEEEPEHQFASRHRKHILQQVVRLKMAVLPPPGPQE